MIRLQSCVRDNPNLKRLVSKRIKQATQANDNNTAIRLNQMFIKPFVNIEIITSNNDDNHLIHLLITIDQLIIVNESIDQSQLSGLLFELLGVISQ